VERYGLLPSHRQPGGFGRLETILTVSSITRRKNAPKTFSLFSWSLTPKHLRTRLHIDARLQNAPTDEMILTPLYQGTTSVVPKKSQKQAGLQPQRPIKTI